MARLIVSEWMSLDGVFDADPEYFSEWFLPFHSDARASHITRMIESAAALLLGRTTYEMLAPFWSSQANDDAGPAAKLNAMPKYVVSAGLKVPIWDNTKRIIRDNVAEEIAALRAQEASDVLVIGSGTLVDTLVSAGIVDEFRFLVHPVVMRRGKRLFETGSTGMALELHGVETFEHGVVALHYRSA